MRIFCSRLIGVPAVVTAALLLVSCNSSGLGSDNSSSTTNESATGVWSGTDSASGSQVIAIINSAGQATFIYTSGYQFVGSAQVSGSTLAVTVDGYSDFPNSTFSDGSTYGIGTLNGAVTTGTSLTATLSFTTNGGTALSGSWSLSYLSQSNNASSPAAISGNYTDTSTGAVLSINSAGVITNSGTGPDGCALNGSVSTGDTSHNIYEVSYTYESCTSTYAGLNGVQFTGLATLDTSVSPAQLLIAVTGASSTNKYSIVSTLNGS